MAKDSLLERSRSLPQESWKAARGGKGLPSRQGLRGPSASSLRSLSQVEASEAFRAFQGPPSTLAEACQGPLQDLVAASQGLKAGASQLVPESLSAA